MRLDKFLCEMELGTRSQVKNWIKQGCITVNGSVVTDADRKVDESKDLIVFKGQTLRYQKYVYYMLNKPRGTVSATEDNTAPAVVSLLGDDYRKDIFPVGRLDKDTTGLLLLTNDGDLAHRLLSPRRHVDKTYRVEIKHPLSEAQIKSLEQGLDIGEDKITLPACVEIIEDKCILLTIQEGKYHQIKRMLEAVDNEVLRLTRTAFGGLALDEKLAPGNYRELTPEELAVLREKAY